MPVLLLEVALLVAFAAERVMRPLLAPAGTSVTPIAALLLEEADGCLSEAAFGDVLVPFVLTGTPSISTISPLLAESAACSSEVWSDDMEMGVPLLTASDAACPPSVAWHVDVEPANPGRGRW